MSEPQAAQNTGLIFVDRYKKHGDVAVLIQKLQFMGEMDADLLLEIADRLAALGRDMTAEWLMGQVFGSERDDVLRSMLESAPPAPGEVTEAARRVSSAAWTALDMRWGGGRIDEWDRHLKAAVEALDKALDAAAAPGAA